MRLLFLLMLVCACLFAEEPAQHSNPSTRPEVEKRFAVANFGRILVPNPQSSWRQWHCGMAGAIPLANGGYRIFVTGRKLIGDGKSHWVIGRVDVDKNLKIVDESPEPLIDLGQNTIMPSIVRDPHNPNILRMYFSSVGTLLAISTDNGLSFTIQSNQPLMPADAKDPMNVGTSYVWEESGRYRMLYTGMREQYRDKNGNRIFVITDINGKSTGLAIPDGVTPPPGAEPDLRFELGYADSPDGIHWTKPQENIALPLPNGDSSAKPSVFRDSTGQGYWMAYSYAVPMTLEAPVRQYKIRLAHSDDGAHWKDVELLLDKSGTEGAFDSERVEYPYIVPTGEKDTWLLFYSGNHFGGTGLGAAKIKLKR